MKVDKEVDIAIVGAGLVGALLALLLAKKGYKVHLFERRPDMRITEIGAGRSINLNISCRGLEGLRRVGVLDAVTPGLVPLRGRMMHSKDGELTFQPYGKNDTEFGNSVSRGSLNEILLERAEETGKVEIRFNQKATEVDFETNTIVFEDRASGGKTVVKAKRILGTDGAGSKIREAMMKLDGYECNIDPLEYGYKELTIPPANGGGFRIEKEALHIWPRGDFMQMALPNADGSFTVTLYLPFKGKNSFEILNDDQSIMEFFNTEFADSVPLMPELLDSFNNNPTGHMETVKCHPWHVGGKALILGDAAHAIVPFFGQGMNCGFEDVSIFDDFLNKFLEKGIDASELVENDNKKVELVWYKLFESIAKERKPNADSIADMALDNFIEMRDKVGDPQFLLRKKVEKLLEKRFDGKYISRYALVTFTNVPYKLAEEAGLVCKEILDEICSDLKNPEDVDYDKASQLIDSKLTPLLKRMPEMATSSSGA